MRLIAVLLSLWLAVPAAAGQMSLLGAGGPVAAAGLPLDGVSNVKIAWSTRKLRTAYAGNALRVRETTGNTTQDIGFSSNVLDTAAITTFCSGKTCVVDIMYDQSTSANDAFNPNTAVFSSPVIYTGGAFKTINSKPVLFWDPTASPKNTLISSVSANPVNTIYVNSVVNMTSAGGDNDIGNVSGCDGFDWGVGQGGGTKVGLNKFCNGAFATSTTSVSYGTGGVYEADFNLSSSAYNFWIDGAGAGSGTASGQTFTARTRQFGNTSNAVYTSGLQGEYIEIDQVGSFSGRSALQANQKAYWGTP